jgi:hypothetical protein
MPWQPYTAIVFCLEAGGGQPTDFSSVSEPAATACAPTAPSDEPGVGDDASSTLRDELQPSLLLKF